MPPLAWIALGLLALAALAVNYVGGGNPLPPRSETSAVGDKCRRSGTEDVNANQ